MWTIVTVVKVAIAARLPLFGGLATDVQGMRALYRLANVGGAILDHAHGEAMMPAQPASAAWWARRETSSETPMR